MGFSAIALPAALLVLLAAFLLRKRLGFWKVCAALAAILLIEAAGVWMINRASFKTPEEAYASARMGGKGEPTVCLGEETALVMEYRGGERRFAIVEKTEKGWKRGDQRNVEMRSCVVGDMASALVLHKKGTGDYYLDLVFWADGDPSVRDACDSQFLVTEYDGTKQYTALIRDWSENYTLVIDGMSYELKDTSLSN